MIGVVDTEGGNLLSVCKAIEFLGWRVELVRDADRLSSLDRVVVPGVGAFGVVMGRLRDRGFAEALESVRRTGTPVLGICLGMQLMARRSFERGRFDGLGWFDADVVRLSPSDPDMRVPHVGWHDTLYRDGSALFRSTPQGADYYYVHGYHFVPDTEVVVEAWFDYDGRVVSAVNLDNVMATQFHPEKSQVHGLRVLENFLSWTC